MTITKDTAGVSIELLLEDEYESPDAQFDDADTVKWIREQQAAGNEFAWFCARMLRVVKMTGAGNRPPRACLTSRLRNFAYRFWSRA